MASANLLLLVAILVAASATSYDDASQSKESQIECEWPRSILHGTYSIYRPPSADEEPLFPPHTKVVYRCKHGLRLVGPNTKRECNSNGQWSGDERQPSCIKIVPTIATTTASPTTTPSPAAYCVALRPARGKFCHDDQCNKSSSVDYRVALSQTITFRCQKGYKLRGPTRAVCGTHGWRMSQNKMPACVEIDRVQDVQSNV